MRICWLVPVFFFSRSQLTFLTLNFSSLAFLIQLKAPKFSFVPLSDSETFLLSLSKHTFVYCLHQQLYIEMMRAWNSLSRILYVGLPSSYLEPKYIFDHLVQPIMHLSGDRWRKRAIINISISILCYFYPLLCNFCFNKIGPPLLWVSFLVINIFCFIISNVLAKIFISF